MLTFNGLGWPHTPRIDLVQGDTVHWRFVNVSALEHPLHLHGSYFRVDAKGDGARGHDLRARGPAPGRDGARASGQTMSMTWSPLHSGNWIFHCHIREPHHTARVLRDGPAHALEP